MFKNHLLIAIRNLRKHAFISFINLFGITVGLTCCLLIFSYILNELSYDRSNKNADHIYRVTRGFYTAAGNQTLHLGSVAPPFGPLLKNDFPDIQEVTRIYPAGTSVFKYGDKVFNQSGLYFADEHLRDFFPLHLVEGDPKTALVEPYSILLTREEAKKYFGNEDPLNKVIRADQQFILKVTGVYKAFPANTHFHPDVLISFNTLKDSTVYGEKGLETNWGNNSFYTYLLLPPHYPVKKMEAQFPAFIDRHMGSSDDPSAMHPSKTTKLFLQKLADIHLYSHLDSELEQNGDINRVYIFSVIALFILLIAGINYMNLSTARSALRAKEIGIRKVVGAQRRSIITQFLGESVLLTYMAMILALLLTAWLLPSLGRLSDRELSFHELLQWKVLVPVLILPVITGLISGIYPALFMSSFRPVAVLKGVFKAGNRSLSLRKVLVVTQFAISIVLIIATAVVFRQLRYMQNASLGFDKDHVLTMGYNGALNNRFETFRSALMQHASIKDLGLSSRIPSGRLLDEMGTKINTGDSAQPDNISLKFVNVDKGFIPTYGIPIAAGRNFSDSYATDSNNYIINEAAVKMLGWKDARNAVGKDITYGGVAGKVVGVTKDFHFESMRQPIVPLLLQMGAEGHNGHHFHTISVKIGGADIAGSIDRIRDLWKQFVPDTPFSYTFLDKRFERLYRAETRQGVLFSIFAAIAIFIACLGLFGLSAFSISQRIKEIGIRKVLGADVSDIVQLLSKDFLKLVLIAAVVAFPVAWYFMNKWLQDFAYRIHIEWWILVAAGLTAAIIALITISFLAIRAAVASPVKNLRTE